MRKILLAVFGLLLLNSVTFAEPAGLKDISTEITGIGKVHRYQMGNNVFIGANFNLETLYIATAVGSNFEHKAYCYVENGFSEAVKQYFATYIGDENARRMEELSQKMVDIPEMRFPKSIVGEVLSREPVFMERRLFKNSLDAKICPFDLGDTLKAFYQRTTAQNYFAGHLSEYNRMIDEFVTKYNFNHVVRLKEFFGFDMDKDRFEVILSPLYSGGEALEVANWDGTSTYIAILNPRYHNETPENDAWILNALYHETAHNYLSGVLSRNGKLIKNYEADLLALVGPAQGIVKNSAFSFLNEMLARVATLALLEKFHGPEIMQYNLKREQRRGWEDLDQVYCLVKNQYFLNRQQYPTLDSFLPVVLQYFRTSAKNQPQVTSKAVDEIVQTEVVKAYWEGEPSIQFYQPPKKNSFLIEVQFSNDNPLSDQIGTFLERAGHRLLLTAPGKPQVVASAYQGRRFIIQGKEVWGLWLCVPDEDLGKIEAGIEYILIPEKQDKTYQWVIGENVRVVRR